MLPHERRQDLAASSIFAEPEAASITVQAPQGGAEAGRGQEVFRTFQFDAVLDESSSQDSLYRAARVGDIVQAVCEGFHGTIFAYGQTGSGTSWVPPELKI